MKRHAILLALCFFVGCAAYTRHGLYDAAPVEGWRLISNRGSARFLSLMPGHTDRGVIFATPRKGELFVRFYFPTEGEVKFESQELRVMPHDGASPRFVPLSLEMTFAVPENEFSVQIPPFSVGSQKMPRLQPRFVWNNRSYSVAPVE